MYIRRCNCRWSSSRDFAVRSVLRPLLRSLARAHHVSHVCSQDLIAAGIIDPAKVTRSGLTNACGIAGIMLTTQVGLISLLGYVRPAARKLHLRWRDGARSATLWQIVTRQNRQDAARCP